MRALLDTDVVLDVIAEREPFIHEAAEIFDLNEQGIFEAYICGITPVNVFYIARKGQSSSDLKSALGQLLKEVGVCPVDLAVLRQALVSPITDYEDAGQHECASAAGLDAIVTRNLSDYKNATLPVYSPTDFLSRIKPQQP
jgi:predicted nucleic acid-binding protein